MLEWIIVFAILSLLQYYVPFSYTIRWESVDRFFNVKNSHVTLPFTGLLLIVVFVKILILVI